MKAKSMYFFIIHLNTIFVLKCASSSFLKLHMYLFINLHTYFEFLLQKLPYSKDWALPLNLALKKYEGYNMVHKQDKKLGPGN